MANRRVHEIRLAQRELTHDVRRHVRVALLGQIAVRRATDEPRVTRWIEPATRLAGRHDLNRLLRLTLMLIAAISAIAAIAAVSTIATISTISTLMLMLAAALAISARSTSTSPAMTTSVPAILISAVAISAIIPIAILILLVLRTVVVLWTVRLLPGIPVLSVFWLARRRRRSAFHVYRRFALNSLDRLATLRRR
jgi:hypothetical protein